MPNGHGAAAAVAGHLVPIPNRCPTGWAAAGEVSVQVVDATSVVEQHGLAYGAHDHIASLTLVSLVSLVSLG
jgi:hypothetical protein